MKKTENPKRNQLMKDIVLKFADPQVKNLFYKSCALIVMSKSLAIASPVALKFVIDGMAAAEGVKLN